MGNKNTGNVARSMASAPLHIDETQQETAAAALQTADAPTTAVGAAMAEAIVERMQEEQAETLVAAALPFSLVGFKLNGKAKDYPVDNEPGATSRKVAFAVIKVADSKLTFQAAINVVSTPITSGEHKGKSQRKIACKFPNQGLSTGYKPMFETDDPRVEREIAILRKHIADEYVLWSKTLEIRPELMAGRTHDEDTVSIID